MKKHIILFIVVFFASILHAQVISIKGTITDTNNETTWCIHNYKRDTNRNSK